MLMKWTLAVACLCAVCGVAGAAEEKAKPANALAFTMKDIDGKDVDLNTYKGKVIMMVNVASKCGNTKQYTPLEAIYKKYKEEGLVILAFPANNFGGQEPGSDKDIKEFCSGGKYNVTFPLFSKISVKGEDKHPLYQYLTTVETQPVKKGEVSWNFEKFLIGRDGTVKARFSPRTQPDAKDVVEAIESELKAGK